MWTFVGAGAVALFGYLISVTQVPWQGAKRGRALQQYIVYQYRERPLALRLDRRGRRACLAFIASFPCSYLVNGFCSIVAGYLSCVVVGERERERERGEGDPARRGVNGKFCIVGSCERLHGHLR